MKLHIKPLELRESTDAPLKIQDAVGMMERYKQSLLNKIADYAQKLGFPKEFKIELHLEGHEKPVEFEYDLNDKTINDEKDFHTITFNYEQTSRSYREFRHDFGDDEDEKQEEVFSALAPLMDLYVIIEFTNKFDKVYATTH